MVLLGSVTSSKMDFTKISISKFIGKMQKLQICFASGVKYDTIKHFAAFGSVLYVFHRKKKILIFIQKWLEHMLLMTLYVITIATDCHQTLPQSISRENEQLLKMSEVNYKCS